MVKWTDAKLKRQAIREWKDCYECGHFPDFICDQPYVSEEELDTDRTLGNILYRSLYVYG